MRTLFLDSQISITSLGSCSSWHSQGVSQLNKWARDLPWTSGGSIYTPSFKTNRWEVESALCGVTGCSGQLSPPLCQKEPLSSDRTLICVRSSLTRRVRSRKTLFGTLLMLTRRWHPESYHLAIQCSVSYRILTSVRSASTGRV